MEPGFQVGEWKVEPGRDRISGPQGSTHLEPKVMEVLVALAARPGDVFSKDELLEAVWTDCHVVEEVLTRSISHLRRALHDSPQEHSHIETIPKRGYRLIAPVSKPGDEAVLSLAVLPLANLSGDPDQEYLADGITELLITDLSKIASLSVISRTSVMQYKAADQPLPDIAHELDVTRIVEGSVARLGDQIRITAQLIDAGSDTHLWAKAYQRPINDVLALQSEIASTVAGEISAHLSPRESAALAKTRAVDPAAYDLYLKGLFAWSRRRRESFEEAIGLFTDAMARDPEWALPYSGLADTYIVLGLYGLSSPVEAFELARGPCARALELDDQFGQAHISTAGIRAYFDWDLEVAEKIIRRGIALTPSYAVGHLGLADILTAQRRHDEALREISAAVSLNPLDAGMNMNLGDHLIWAGRLEEGVAPFERALEIDPRFQRGWLRLARAHALLGNTSRAQSAMSTAVDLAGSEEAVLPAAASVLALLGRRDEARTRLAVLSDTSGPVHHSPLEIAEAFAHIGDADAAFAWLARAIKERTSWLIFLGTDPAFKGLRSDPRFADCLAAVGLPAAGTVGGQC